MNHKLANQLERAVVAICPEIAVRNATSSKRLCEQELRRELLLCILSSQVHYALAVGAVNAIDDVGLFTDVMWNSTGNNYLNQLLRVLTSPISVCGKQQRYRFPNCKARQINTTRALLIRSGLPLSKVVYSDRSASDRRRELQHAVCGFGPKQASMFLRNTHATAELAILDTHVLKYMRLQHMTSKQPATMELRTYELLERKFIHYSDQLGFAPGYVDLAIWIVMRAALEESLL